jgi:Rad3-related DNA helicase
MSRSLSDISSDEKLIICKAVITASYLGKERTSIIENFDIVEDALQELEAAALSALQSVVEPSTPELDEFEKITQLRAAELKQEKEAVVKPKNVRKPSELTPSEEKELNNIFTAIQNYNKKKENTNSKIYPSLGVFQDCWRTLVQSKEFRDVSDTAIKKWYEAEKHKVVIAKYIATDTDLKPDINKGRGKASVSEKLGYASHTKDESAK